VRSAHIVGISALGACGEYQQQTEEERRFHG
jgi:hypothetical protein